MAYKINESCVGCGACQSACPVGAISVQDGKATINEAACIECGTCAGVCPVSAPNHD